MYSKFVDQKTENFVKKYSEKISSMERTSTSYIENRINLGRNLVEGLLYFSLICRIFGNQLGVLNFTGLSGAIIVSSVVVCIVVMISQRQEFPISLVFALMINFMASITDLFLIDLITREMVYWMSALLMACFIVRDQRAALRFEWFLAFTIFLTVAIGGEFLGEAQGFRRMALKGSEVGSMFANSNDLAQLASMVAIALLFSSFKLKALGKMLCWAGALALSGMVLLTLSRQGLFLLGVGFVLFLLASAKGPGGKVGPIVLVALALLASIVYADDVARIVSGYEYRLGLSSDRVSYWRTAPQDMMGTLISGSGTYGGFTTSGMKPHNTFLWLHLAYGGLCAWTYVAWLGWLSLKTMQLVLGPDAEWRIKMEVLAMFSLFFMAQFVTVFAPSNYGYILGIALLERQFSLAKKNEISD